MVLHETQGRTGKGGSAVFLKSAAMAPHKRQIGPKKMASTLSVVRCNERCAVGNVGNGLR